MQSVEIKMLVFYLSSRVMMLVWVRNLGRIVSGFLYRLLIILSEGKFENLLRSTVIFLSWITIFVVVWYRSVCEGVLGVLVPHIYSEAVVVD